MAATHRDWADPFLEQAREDLRAAWAVHNSQAPSTLCMLIQMVFEKLAKAAYARSGQPYPRVHQAAPYLFQMLRRHRLGKELIQASPQVESFVQQLENAQPSIAGRQSPAWEQLEYPWEDATGATILYPARDLSLARRVSNPRDLIALECLLFASALEKQLTTIIP